MNHDDVHRRHEEHRVRQRDVDEQPPLEQRQPGVPVVEIVLEADELLELVESVAVKAKTNVRAGRIRRRD